MKPTGLANALACVPGQADTWSCGVNCAARALWLSGQPVHDYAAFHRQSPQTFGPQTPDNAHLLARLPGTRWLVRHLLPPVGPHPHLLAAYLNGVCRADLAAQVLSTCDFAACGAAARELLGRGAHLIALWYESLFRAHYVVVDTWAGEEVWSIMNHGQRSLISSEDMAQRMDCARCPWRGCVGLERFNLIALAPCQLLQRQLSVT